MKKFITAIVAAALTTVGASASAGTFAEHERLFQTLQSIGIDVQINPKGCDGSSMGWYRPYTQVVAICQQNGSPGGPQVRWTAEDLDTLRHEAHHVVQDCRDGILNAQLHYIYKDPIELAKNSLSRNTIGWILSDEGYGTLSNHMQVLELEAFSVAALNDPTEQIRDIATYCTRG